MKFVIALFALFAVASAGLLPASGNAAASQILRSESVVNPDSYHYAYETDQGIAAQEDGQLKVISPTESAIVAKGSARWTAPDGTPIEIQYVADENGYQPQSASLPQPPPIPAAIQRALEWIAAHPQQQQ